jgi:hypothetical protein
MKNKVGKCFKRNHGINAYTHVWCELNTMLDGMRHDKMIDYSKTMRRVIRTPIWKMIPYNEQNELLNRIPNKYNDVLKIISKSLEYKRMISNSWNNDKKNKWGLKKKIHRQQ